MLRFSSRRKLVALLGERLVGDVEAAYTTPKETGGITSIYVSSDSRSLGLERLLVEAACNEIVQGGVRRIRIAVPVARQELLETLPNLGFREALAVDAMVVEL